MLPVELLAATLAAEPLPSALNWVRADGAESCPAAPEIARRVEQHLGRTALVPLSEAQLLVEAYVEPRSSGGFLVTIGLTKGQTIEGRRVIESAETTCTDVSDKAALAIAVMIDPEAALHAGADASLPPVAVAPKPAVTPAEGAVASAPPNRAGDAPTPCPPEPKPPPPPALAGELELAAGLATGLMPGSAPGLFVRGRLWPGAGLLGLEIEGAYFPERSAEVQPGRGADFSLLFSGAAVCARTPDASRFGALLCAGAEAGAMVGHGYGFQYNEALGSSFLALAGRARLSFRPFRPLQLLLGPDLTLPLKRDHFETEGPNATGELFRASALSVGFELGLAWAFGS